MAEDSSGCGHWFEIVTNGIHPSVRPDAALEGNRCKSGSVVILGYFQPIKLVAEGSFFFFYLLFQR